MTNIRKELPEQLQEAPVWILKLCFFLMAPFCFVIFIVQSIICGAIECIDALQSDYIRLNTIATCDEIARIARLYKND